MTFLDPAGAAASTRRAWADDTSSGAASAAMAAASVPARKERTPLTAPVAAPARPRRGTVNSGMFAPLCDESDSDSEPSRVGNGYVYSKDFIETLNDFHDSLNSSNKLDYQLVPDLNQ